MPFYTTPKKMPFYTTLKRGGGKSICTGEKREGRPDSQGCSTKVIKRGGGGYFNNREKERGGLTIAGV